MSHPVNVSVQVGKTTLAGFNKLTLSQHVLSHHSFALDFSFEALAKTLNLKPEALFARAHEQLSGQDITISWSSKTPGRDQAGRRFDFKGIITDISIQTDADLSNYYHISGYSPTFLLEDGTQSRTFVKQSLAAIFARVLGDYESQPFTTQLKARRQQVLAYAVQYNETNFNFLSRLAAEQGEWFYYDGTTLRLGSSSSQPLVFKSSSSQVFALRMHLQPGRTQGTHYNYRSHQPLQTQAQAPGMGYALSQFAVEKSAEVFTQPARLQAGTHISDQAQLQDTMDNLAARRALNQVSLEGSGEGFDTRPGSIVDVQDAAGAAYGQFRVLSVRHDVDEAGNYSNHFEAMPEAGAALPPPNPLPDASDAQPELAEVIDLRDPRRLGRVRVRYHWPVSKPADAESSWLRVSTPYSGDGKGQLFTPEVGSQVLVGYEHGLAERPVVLGNVFHPLNKQNASYSPPNNHLKGLQTAGGNKFVLSDVPGAQTILISNSNKKGTSILVSFAGDGSINLTTNGPINITSGDSIALEAKKNISIRAGEDITLAAQKNVLVETQKEDISLRAQKGVQISAFSEDVVLEAESKKLVLNAVGNMELTSSAVVRVNGQDIKLNNPG